MPNDTLHLATGARERNIALAQDPLKAAFTRIEALETVLRDQGKFLDRIAAAETGWWEKNEMAEAQAAIWNVLEGH